MVRKPEPDPVPEKYPVRKQYFAAKFTRLLAKRCVAQDVGSLGYVILSVIVQTEDSSRYSRAVTFYDYQLMPMVGAGSQRVLAIARKRCVESGWLHYEPGRKAHPGRYWVVIPPSTPNHEDTPVDDDDSFSSPIPHLQRDESVKNRWSNGEESVEQRCINSEATVTILPTPNPSPEEYRYAGEDLIRNELEIALQAQADSTTFKTPLRNHPGDEFYRKYPRKMKSGLVAEAFDSAVVKLVQEGMSTASARSFLINVASEYSESPAGQPGEPDTRPAPSTFLDQERWKDGRDEWQKPNGRPARSPPRKLAEDLVSEGMAEYDKKARAKNGSV